MLSFILTIVLYALERMEGRKEKTKGGRKEGNTSKKKSLFS